jgi:two-component system, probable response regulator PhcQ
MTAPAPVVLCVDDDPEMVASVARFLRLDGYELVTCTAPAQALAVLGARAVSVMVSDYEMPEMTGVELAVKARRLQPETVRILLTGRGTLDTAVEGINVGEVFRFLSKPFDPDVLRREVAAAVAHHAEVSAAQRERTTVVRRQRLLGALEADYPGITAVPRDDDGAYLLDGDARHRAGPLLSAMTALIQR